MSYALKNSITHEKKVEIQTAYGDIDVRVRQTYHYNWLSVSVDFPSGDEQSISIEADSMYIYYDNNRLNCDSRVYGVLEKNYKPRWFQIIKTMNYVWYHCDMDTVLDNGEAVILFANDFLKIEDDIFDIDTLNFYMDRKLYGQ